MNITSHIKDDIFFFFLLLFKWGSGTKSVSKGTTTCGFEFQTTQLHQNVLSKYGIR